MDPQPPVEEVNEVEEAPAQPEIAHIYVEDDEILQPTSIAKQLIDFGSLVLVGRMITLLDLELIITYLSTAGYGTTMATSLGLNGPQVYLACYERARPYEGDDHEGDTHSDISAQRQRDMFDRMVRELFHVDLSLALGLLGAVVREHEDYRLGWLANLAVSFRDEGMDHYAAQRGAARFMRQLFHVDVTKDKHFQHEPVHTDEEEPDTDEAADAAEAHALADTTVHDDVSEAPHRTAVAD